jgi:hypothetical protein
MNNENGENQIPDLKAVFNEISCLREEISHSKYLISEGISFLKERKQKFDKSERRIEAIEGRIETFFPDYKELRISRTKKIELDQSEDLWKLSKELEFLLKEKDDYDFHRKMTECSDKTVRALALELKISDNNSKTGIKKLITEIKKYLQESIAISRPPDLDIQKMGECFGQTSGSPPEL